jgi:UDPglucose 6-dehydrogenase
MRITVLGSGCVGLVSAAGFAEMGHHVLCVDIDAARIDALRAGKVPFFEPGLQALVDRCATARRLSFATEIAEPYTSRDVYFAASGTPAAPGVRRDGLRDFAPWIGEQERAGLNP